MNPILKYILNVSVFQRMMGDDVQLEGLAHADTLLSELVKQKKVPGLSITVLKEGKLLLQKGYGYADLERKTPVEATKTIFRIASVSKPIAATALAHMVADGLIDLDASFYNYVPYFPKKKWDFTIRQLASHTAGIRGYQGVEYGLNQPMTIKEGIAVFKNDDLVFKPGNGYVYNSYDWVLISLAMQEVSGIPFESYIRQKVLVPLGMENTFAPDRIPSIHDDLTDLAAAHSTDQNPIDMVTGKRPPPEKVTKIPFRTRYYSKSRLGFRPAISVNNFYKLAGGGYLSTSEDIAKLGQAYLDGEILNKKLHSQFLTSQKVNGKPTYYGLGWQVSEDSEGRSFYGHVGNGVGGYSNLFVYPKEQMVFAILVNCTDPKIQGELDGIVHSLLAKQNLPK